MITVLRRSAVLAGLILLLAAQPAFAHNKLVSTSPGNGASLNAPPARISFTFGEPVQRAPDYDAITITGPGDTHWPTSHLTVYGDTISAAPGPLGPAGVYTLAYRIVGADGHPSGGQITITLTTPGNGQPLTTASLRPAATSGPGSVPAWQGLAALALLAAAGFGITARRRLTAARENPAARGDRP